MASCTLLSRCFASSPACKLLEIDSRNRSAAALESRNSESRRSNSYNLAPLSVTSDANPRVAATSEAFILKVNPSPSAVSSSSPVAIASWHARTALHEQASSQPSVSEATFARLSRSQTGEGHIHPAATNLCNTLAIFNNSFTARPSAAYKFLVFNTMRAFVAITWAAVVRNCTR